jgi:hypothetical protein
LAMDRRRSATMLQSSRPALRSRKTVAICNQLGQCGVS